MIGKLTTILAKKEAEVYCAQGLHQEALRLYKRLLASSPNIDKAFRHAIENQMAAIKDQMRAAHPDEHSMLSAQDILRLKEGWGANATEGDLLVCAQAFYRIGHYRSALAELVKMMEKGCQIKALLGLFADCMVAMCQPPRLLPTLERLTRHTFKRPETHLAFTLLLTEKMVARKHKAHATVLLNFLQASDIIKAKVPKRLAATARAIDTLE